MLIIEKRENKTESRIMKFGKEYASQMVPEWQEAYMDYNYLKNLLKDIRGVKLQEKATVEPAQKAGLERKITFYRAFSGLTQKRAPSFSSKGSTRVEDQVIFVKGSEEISGGHYETKFLMSSDTGGEYELVFFRRLDDEFNKVNGFYKGKVEDVMKEAALLNKQMDALIAFRIRVEKPEGTFDWSTEMTRLRSNLASSSAAAAAAAASANEMASTAPSGGAAKSPSPYKQGMLHMDSIQEDDLDNEENGNSGDRSAEVNTKPVNSNHPSELNLVKRNRPAPLEVLNHVKLNNTLETPRSTLKGLLNVNNNELQFKREDLRRVEEQLQNAFVEFYQKLRVLKSYSFLNLLAFSKIMKKYDKITSRNASKSYLKMVDGSYLGSSDEVNKLMLRVEATFIKHFANANRSKGMTILRPKARRERHRITFLLGFFTGCTVALVAALVFVIHARKIIEKPGSAQYMENMFPLYSLFGFVFVHIVMFGANIFLWRHYRVNFSFIFGFKPETEMSYREVLLLGTGLATLALICVLSNLDMEMNVKTKSYEEITELLPLGLLCFVLAITFCPLDVMYHPSRFFLLRCIFRCLCAPLYKVTLQDFFMGDQLTSQVQALRSLVFYICYFGWGDYKHRRSTCKNNEVYETFTFIIATVPYWSRFLQCLRRLYEEKDPHQGYNALKYLSTIVAVCMRTLYSKMNTAQWRIIALVSSCIATVFGTYWDLVVDWGLLQPHSKNPWLRDKLLISRHRIYYYCMVLNVVLRFAWLQTVYNYQVSFLHKEALIAIVSSLEIVRRGMWNFFRLENEHLNNVGKFRAFKSVPLPFNYNEDEEDKDL